MLSKRLICLSLIVTTLFVSNRVFCMSALLGAIAIKGTAVAAGAKSVAIGAGAIAATGAAGTVAVAAGGLVAVGGAGFGLYYGGKKIKNWWCARSPATIKAEEVARQLEVVAKQSKEVLEQIVQQQRDTAQDKIKVLEQDNSKLIEENKKLNRILVRIALHIQDKFPRELWEKLVLYCQSSCNIIKQGGNYVWTITFKNHPNLTITVIVLSAGYGIHKKYGKKIKESIQQKLPDSCRAEGRKPVDMISVTYESDKAV